jgi:hypothetical protein
VWRKLILVLVVVPPGVLLVALAVRLRNITTRPPVRMARAA